MADFDYDLDEIVTWGAAARDDAPRGSATIYEIISGAARPSRSLSSRGKGPASFDSNAVEVIASEIS
jgi:hypothetical protein